MRFNLISTKRPKTVAKKLKKAASAIGIELKLSRAQHAVARMYGYANWLDLHSSVGGRPLSPLDDELTDDELMARQAYQSNALAVELDINLEVATALVDAVPPTGRLGGAQLQPDDGEVEDNPGQETARYW